MKMGENQLHSLNIWAILKDDDFLLQLTLHYSIREKN